MAQDSTGHNSPTSTSGIDQALDDFYLLEAVIGCKERPEGGRVDVACSRLEAWLLEQKAAAAPLVSVPAEVTGKVVGLAAAQAGGIA